MAVVVVVGADQGQRPTHAKRRGKTGLCANSFVSKGLLVIANFILEMVSAPSTGNLFFFRQSLNAM